MPFGNRKLKQGHLGGVGGALFAQYDADALIVFKRAQAPLDF